MATASARPPEVQHSVSSGPIGTTTRPNSTGPPLSQTPTRFEAERQGAAFVPSKVPRRFEPATRQGGLDQEHGVPSTDVAETQHRDFGRPYTATAARDRTVLSDVHAAPEGDDPGGAE